MRGPDIEAAVEFPPDAKGAGLLHTTTTMLYHCSPPTRILLFLYYRDT